MKLVAVIVVYEPDIKSLLYNIGELIEDVDQLIIYQNSDIYTVRNELEKYGNKLVYLGSGENIGIAGALNEGVKWAQRNHYSHILTLDQDSSFERGHLSKFKYLIENSLASDVGIFCANISNRGSVLIESDEQYVKVSDSITSGSIFPLETFEKGGLFETELFIDAVDYEFCYRIFSKNMLSTIIFPEIILLHEVGYPTKITFGFMTDNYSAFRTYHIVKNHSLIWRRYPTLFQKSYKKTLIKTHIIYRTIKVLIGEKDKLSKITAIYKGLFHGLTVKIK
ncbi:glycosyltransferase [Flavobacterium frigidarium]|uniref:glycosyltransferase n=1 Tax=Flavobacterium frigidarium TaxID=99286 RepID=UPI0003F8AE8E|nr:glycosyltransferase [Flavobacterium frigidarium]